jgi:quercetin dioxygenase-like cupin family protein
VTASPETSPILAVPGTRYDARRQWLLPQGVVARDLARHPLFPRPKKNASGRSYAVSFDELAGNTLLGMHVSRLQPGAHNRGHRHVDEALILIVAGEGWSELRQSDDAEMQRIEWQAGDLLAIPANAWHQHFNASAEHESRQLAFKDTRFLRNVFGSRRFVYDNDFRFEERYADEADYWTSRTVEDGVVITNAIHGLADEPLDPASWLGDGVRAARYRLGGHRNLEAAVTEIAPGGSITSHRHRLSEEATFVLAGSGVTELRPSGGPPVTFTWGPGDLFCPPLGVEHGHRSTGEGPARLLTVRNAALEHALKAIDDGLDVAVPDRMPSIVEPDYSGIEPGALELPET